MTVPRYPRLLSLDWSLWSTLLAITPYSVYSATAPVPFRFGLIPLSVSLIITTLFDQNKRRGHTVQAAFIAIGRPSTVFLFLLELVWSLSPAIQQVAISRSIYLDVLFFLELSLAIFSLTGWAFAGRIALHRSVNEKNGRSALDKKLLPALYVYVLTITSAVVFPPTPIESRGAVIPICLFASSGLLTFLLSGIWTKSPLRSRQDPTNILTAILIARISGFIAAGEALQYGFTALWATGFTIPWLPLSPPAAIAAVFVLEHRHQNRIIEQSNPGTLMGATESRFINAGPSLSPREKEVLARTLKNETAKQIASDIGITASTVSTIRSRIYRKLGVNDALELKRLLSQARPDMARDMGPVDGPRPSSAHRIPLLFLLVLAILVIVWSSEAIESCLSPDPASPLQLPYFTAWLGAIFLLTLSLARAQQGCSHHRTGPIEGDRSSVFRLSGQLTAICLTLFIGSHYWVWSIQGLMALSALPLCALTRVIHVRHIDDPKRSPENDPNNRAFRVLSAITSLSPSTPLLVGSSLAMAPILYSNGIFADIVMNLASIQTVFAAACLVLSLEISMERRRLECDESDRQKLLLAEKGITGLQADVLLTIAQGLGESEICNALCTTKNTVKSYRQRAYRKLGVHSVDELREFLAVGTVVTDTDELHPS